MPSEDMWRRWRLWEERDYPEKHYPPGSDEAAPGGVDLALADGDAAALLHEFFENGSLGPQGQTVLDHLVGDLERVVPTLAPGAQAYFREMLDLLVDVRSATEPK